MLRLSPRARRVVPLTILLAVSVFLLVFVGLRVTRASLEIRNERRVQAGESLGVRPWMTLPYIARTYNVPEDELFAALDLDNAHRNRRIPLQALAGRDDRDLEADMATLNAIIDRRQTPRPPPTPGGAP